jgi:hypothetical protein
MEATMAEHDVYRIIGSTRYGVEGAPSKEFALLHIYKEATRDGNYRLPSLREKWWQFWRPVCLTEFEEKLSAALSEGRDNG